MMRDYQKSYQFSQLNIIKNQLSKLRERIRGKRLRDQKDIPSYIEKIHNICKEIKSNLPNEEAKMTVDCAEELALAEFYEKNCENNCLIALDNFVKLFNKFENELFREFLIVDEFLWFTNVLINLGKPDLINKLFKEMSGRNPEEVKMLNFFYFRTLACLHLANKDFDSALTYLALQQHHNYSEECLQLLEIDSDPHKDNECIKLLLEFKKLTADRKLVKAQDYIDLILFASKTLKEKKELRFFTYKYAMSVLNEIDITDKEKQQLELEIFPAWKKSESLKSRTDLLMKKFQTQVPDKQIDKKDHNPEVKDFPSLYTKMIQQSAVMTQNTAAPKQNGVISQAPAEQDFLPLYTKAVSNTATNHAKKEISDAPKENGVATQASVMEAKISLSLEPEQKMQTSNAVTIEVAQNRSSPQNLPEEYAGASIKLKQYLKDLTEKKEVKAEDKTAIRQYLDSLIKDPDYNSKSPLSTISDIDRRLVAKIYNLLNKDTVWQALIDNALKFLESKEVNQSNLLLSHKRNMDKLLSSPKVKSLQLLTISNEKKINAIYLNLIKNMLNLLKNVYESQLDALREAIIPMIEHLKMNDKENACAYLKKFFEHNLAESVEAAKINQLSTQLGMLIVDNLQFCFSTNEETGILDGVSYFRIAEALFNVCLCPDLNVDQRNKIKAFLSQLEHVQKGNSNKLKVKIEECFSALTTPAYVRLIIADAFAYTKLQEEKKANLLLSHKAAIDKLIREYDKTNDKWLTDINQNEISLIRYQLFCSMLVLLGNINEIQLPMLRASIEEIITQLRPAYLDPVGKLMKEFFERTIKAIITSADVGMLIMHNFELCINANDTVTMLNDKDYLLMADIILKICQCPDLKLADKSLIKSFLVDLESVNMDSPDALYTKIDACLLALDKDKLDKEQKIKQQRENNQPFNDLMLQIKKLKELTEMDRSRIKKLKYNILGRAPDSIKSNEKCLRIDYLQLICLKNILANLRSILFLTKDENVSLKELLISLKNNSYFGQNVNTILRFMETGEMPSHHEEKQNAQASQEVKDQIPAVRPPNLINKVDVELEMLIAREQLYRNVGRSISTRPDLILKEVDEKEFSSLDKIALSNLSKGHNYSAILIKCGEKFKLFGFKATGGWSETLLEIKPFQHLKFNSAPVLLDYQDDQSSLAMYYEIISKRAHAFTLNRNISEDAWLEQVKNYLTETSFSSKISFANYQNSMDDEFNTATRMRDIIFSLETEARQCKEGKDQQSKNLYFCSTLDMARLLSECPDIFNRYKEKYQVKIGHPYDEALEIFISAMSLAKSYNNLEYLTRCLAGIATCVINGKYDLALMSAKDLKKKNIIKIESLKSGLKYQVIRLDNKECNGLIPWDNLPKGFPRDNEEIVLAQDRLLPHILEFTSKEEHTPRIPTDLSKVLPTRKAEVVKVIKALRQTHPGIFETYKNLIQNFDEPMMENKDFPKANNHSPKPNHLTPEQAFFKFMQQQGAAETKDDVKPEEAFKKFMQNEQGATETKDDQNPEHAFAKFMQQAKGSAAASEQKGSASTIMQFFQQAEQLKNAALVGAGVGFFSNGFYEGGFKGAGSAVYTLGLFALAIYTLGNVNAYYQHCQKQNKRRR